MLIDLEAWRARAREGVAESAGAQSSFIRADAGEGAFQFDHVTVGVVLTPVPTHRARYVSDQLRALPLAAGEGWIFPAGAEGFCSWSQANDFVNITLPSERFAEAGLDAVKLGALGAGALDPLTVSLALQIHGAGAEGAAATMYRDTLASALAMHVGVVFAAKPSMSASALDDARLKRAQDLIETRLGEDLSLDDLAASAGISPFHFARAFKAYTGLAPHQFLIARRIEHAKVLLRTTALPIAEIAARVGWENAGKFAAQFKKLTGATPGAWRAG